MNIALGLLALIAIFEGLRLYSIYRRPSKRAYFKQRAEATKHLIWDLEFKVFKTREVREQVRGEMVNMESRIASFDIQIAAWPKDGNVDELNRVKDAKVLAERDRDRLRAQIQQIDEEIGGAKPSKENPEGSQGIMYQIDSLREVEGMLKDWIKAL